MKKWLMSFGAALMLLGCASQNTAGIKIEGQTQTVTYGNERVGNRYSIEDIATLENNGNARGIVKIANKTSYDETFQYRFYWFDEQGIDVSRSQAPWKRVILRGDETVTLSEVSVNPNGKNFRLQLRKAD